MRAPLPAGEPSPTKADSAVQVIAESADGRPLRAYGVDVKLDSELDPGDDQTGLVDAVLSVDSEANVLKLVVSGRAAHMWREAAQPTTLRSAGAPAADEARVSLTCETHRTPDSAQTFSVQANTGGGRTWQTLAVGLSESSVTKTAASSSPGRPSACR
jgi:hypothetical protein